MSGLDTRVSAAALSSNVCPTTDSAAVDTVQPRECDHLSSECTHPVHTPARATLQQGPLYDPVGELREELRRAHLAIENRDREVHKLSRMRVDIEAEVEDLTASLFEEAHRMVDESKKKQLMAERHLHEAQMKNDVLQAEVTALKTIVLTSTPSKPNTHIHAQSSQLTGKGRNQFSSKHKKCASTSSVGSHSTEDVSHTQESVSTSTVTHSCQSECDCLLMDQILFDQFNEWLLNLSDEDEFYKRMLITDIDPCIDLIGRQLANDNFRQAILNNSIHIELIQSNDESTNSTVNSHHLKFNEDEKSFPISDLCRNRITALCDLLNYIHYIRSGMVKAQPQQIYRRLTQLRKYVSLTRLGYSYPD